MVSERSNGTCRACREKKRRNRVAATCCVDGCSKRALAPGRPCDMHYRRMKAHGTYDGWAGNIALRFSERYEVDESTGCWNWTGYRRPQGYGALKVGQNHQAAHRISYELHVGPIPDGLTIDHLCMNRLCVNPEHLEAVTLHENILRSNNMAAKYAQRTHCKNGHPFSGDNVYQRKDGGRGCRQCQRDRRRRAR